MHPRTLRLCSALAACAAASGALHAQDGQITVNGTVIDVPPGTTTITVTTTGDGTHITTTTATGSSASDVPTPHPAPKPEGVTITRSTQAVPKSPWDLDVFSGVRFGGIIGASIDNTLTYHLPGGEVEPELSANVGVSGTQLGLGMRWSLSTRQWTLSNQGLSLDYGSYTAISLRAIAPYRWEGRHRAPSIWHGMPADSGWYYGAEVDVLVDSVALAAQMTWEEERHQHAPRFTLAYGFGF